MITYGVLVRHAAGLVRPGQKCWRWCCKSSLGDPTRSFRLADLNLLRRQCQQLLFRGYQPRQFSMERRGVSHDGYTGVEYPSNPCNLLLNVIGAPYRTDELENSCTPLLTSCN